MTWGTHSVDCYPGGCLFRVFTKDGKVVREEQAGLTAPVEPGIPDNNPMGCQKGACWSHCLYSPDRVTQPLKRVGERGEGKFEPVSWDEALTDIADAMLDAIEEQGVRVDHHAADAGGRGGARAAAGYPSGPADDRRQRGVPGLQPRLAPHLGALQSDRQHGRLVPGGPDAHLARQPRLHQHPVVPLRRRVAVQRRRGGDDRPGLQPLGDPRRLPPARAHRDRRRPGARDVQGDHRRRALPEAVRPGADRPARCSSARTPAASCAAAR